MEKERETHKRLVAGHKEDSREHGDWEGKGKKGDARGPKNIKYTTPQNTLYNR